MFRKLIRAWASAVLALSCLTANAFAPAAGVWVIASEENGKPGRGFQLDVQNEIIIFYYNGYRSDGTSVFYMAFGPIKDNVFVAQLTEYRGGTVLGAPRKDAAEHATVGNVSITFTSGMSGVITFPGETAKPISKFNYGYPPNQDGLMGTYLLAYSTGSGVFGDKFTLTRKLNPTAYGNGVVVNADGSFGCENITATALAGTIVCTEVSSQPQYDDYYTFRMAGDRGTGTGTWESATLDYPLEVWRTATASGKSTGLNEGTADSLEKLKTARTQDDRQRLRETRKSALEETAGESLLSASERDLLQRWAREAAELIRAHR